MTQSCCCVGFFFLVGFHFQKVKEVNKTIVKLLALLLYYYPMKDMAE